MSRIERVLRELDELRAFYLCISQRASKNTNGQRISGYDRLEKNIQKDRRSLSGQKTS